MDHFRLLAQGNTSLGRSEEAEHLYSTATYETLTSNDLCDAIEEIINLATTNSTRTARALQPIISTLTRAQLRSRGGYEIHATRYELLSGRQGAIGVADPNIISAISNAPAAYSAAGSQAYHSQQQHAIRYAA